MQVIISNNDCIIWPEHLNFKLLQSTSETESHIYLQTTGTDRKDLLKKLKKHAHSEGWQRMHYDNGTSLYCMRKSRLPFNEQEDYTVGFLPPFPFVTNIEYAFPQQSLYSLCPACLFAYNWILVLPLILLTLVLIPRTKVAKLLNTRTVSDSRASISLSVIWAIMVYLGMCTWFCQYELKRYRW